MSTVHNPTNFNPADYTVVDYLDNQPPQYDGSTTTAGFERLRAMFNTHMVAALGTDWASKAHHCVHCGNGRVRYITVCLHAPTGERVVFGADCTARLGFTDRMSFKLALLKSKAEAGHARMKVWRARGAFLAAHPAIAQAIEQAKGPAHASNMFVHDVLGKLDAFGSLSGKQVAAVLASLARDVAAQARKAVEAEEPKGPAPAGRCAVTGVVLSTKVQESSFGDVEKMLVKTANNSKVWLTIPGSCNVRRGDTVTVTATWTVSDTDPHFAFGKRPIVSAVVSPEGTPAPQGEAFPVATHVVPGATTAHYGLSSDPTCEHGYALATKACAACYCDR